MRLLLAEDDLILGEAIHYGLEFNDYQVDWFKDGKQAALASDTQEYDVIVLDVGLPTQSGFEILDQLRGKGNMTPVLILTALDAISDRIKGLDKGADDYLVKPFDLDELLARLRALTRRNQGRSINQIIHGQLVISPTEHRLELMGKPIDLARREFAVLLKLVQNAGRVYSQTELEDYLYNWSDEIESNAVQVYIHHIRKKLGKAFIRTVRGVGYVVDKVN